MSSVARERYLELAVSNKTTDNKYSYRNGIAQLNFQIPEGNYMLDPTSVRICGGIRFYTGLDKTNASNVPGAAGGKDELTISSRLNVYSCFQQLILRSLTHQTSIEHCRHYNQFLSSYLPLTTNLQDSAGHLNQSALIFPNYEVNRTTTVNKDEPNHFCVHLPSGVMNGDLIPMARDWGISGLDLTIMLENDAQALHTLDGSADYTDSWYEFEDLKLVCKVIEPSVDELSKLMSGGGGSLTYQSISSYYDTAMSSNIQANFNLGLSKVRSCFIKIITSDKLNNVAEDGFATLCPVDIGGAQAPINQVQWLKGGSIFPKHFPINTNVRDVALTPVADPELIRDFINSVLSFDKLQHLNAKVYNTNRGWIGTTSGTAGTPYQLVADSGVVDGLGIKYDGLLGSGVDFSSENWGVNIDCGLTTANSQSLFIFVNSEQSLVFNKNGVQSIS